MQERNQTVRINVAPRREVKRGEEERRELERREVEHRELPTSGRVPFRPLGQNENQAGSGRSPGEAKAARVLAPAAAPPQGVPPESRVRVSVRTRPGRPPSRKRSGRGAGGKSAAPVAAALIALALYGILPVLQGTLAGLGAVPSGVLSIAQGMGMTGWQRLIKVELPLAAPVMLAGIRTSTIVNMGTATIASTVGANTLGTPIVIGLSGFNTAYVIQGALLVALAAIIVDRGFERLTRLISRHRREQ